MPNPTPSPAPATTQSSATTRRTLLQGGLVISTLAATSVASATPAVANARRPHAPVFVPSGRGSLTHGVASGDVTHNSAVLWTRADRRGMICARVRIPGTSRWNVLSGSVAHEGTDFTGRVDLRGLRAGETYDYEMFLTSGNGPCQPIRGQFRTAPKSANTNVSFVWTGDTAGQGWGRNADTGMTGYAAMAAVDPDFFIHSGDTIYADGPIKPTVALPDGSVWKNVVSDGVEKVAETLAEFRGRHRYNVGDQHVQAMNARVPIIAQWDDHETVNNWYPGEVLTDPRYTIENRVDVLAQRARQAFTEYFPMDARQRDRYGKIYGKFSRGPLMDVFVVDMRTYRAANSTNVQPTPGPETAFLGERQLRWLLRELRTSRATWKVIAADMPLGLVVGDGATDFEGLANANDGAPLGREHEIAYLLSEIKHRGIKNTVWFTADVHYCAAHEYSPSRGAFTNFDPFWEFVAGPINAGTFGPNKLDMTFGPRVDFSETGVRVNGSPAEGGQFFGHTVIDASTKQMTVKLINALGQVRYTKVLDPA